MAFEIIKLTYLLTYLLQNSLPDNIFDVDLSAPTETLSVPAVLPRCCTVTVGQLCYCDTLSGPSGGSSYRYLGHDKNY